MERNDDPVHNFQLLKRNTYPGRGIVMGMHETGRYLLQLYFVTGRSQQSRNRVFEYDSDILKTAPADPAKLKDPSLIIYTAMRKWGDRYIVSNGDQTDSVYDALRNGRTMVQALDERTYEPDAPNYTPRITGVCTLQSGTVEFGMIRKHARSMRPIRDYYSSISAPGLGRCITTYEENGDPLPSFQGGPYAVPLCGSPEHILECYWDALDKDNRVAIAIKQIEIASGNSEISVINRYEKVLPYQPV
jgi:IMP cyclohydrolase